MEKELFERLATEVGDNRVRAINERNELINDIFTYSDTDELEYGFDEHDFDGEFNEATGETFSYDELSDAAKREFDLFLVLLNDKIVRVVG